MEHYSTLRGGRWLSAGRCCSDDMIEELSIGEAKITTEVFLFDIVEVLRPGD
jgi:hypothetical protein